MRLTEKHLVPMLTTLGSTHPELHTNKRKRRFHFSNLIGFGILLFFSFAAIALTFLTMANDSSFMATALIGKESTRDFMAHPAIMMTAYFFFQAILVGFSSNSIKPTDVAWRATLTAFTSASMVYGLYLAVFAAKKMDIPHMMSLHTWLGTASASLFVAHAIIGCMGAMAMLTGFHYRHISRPYRQRWFSTYIALGNGAFVLSGAAILTGIAELSSIGHYCEAGNGDGYCGMFNAIGLVVAVVLVGALTTMHWNHRNHAFRSASADTAAVTARLEAALAMDDAASFINIAEFLDKQTDGADNTDIASRISPVTIEDITELVGHTSEEEEDILMRFIRLIRTAPSSSNSNSNRSSNTNNAVANMMCNGEETMPGMDMGNNSTETEEATVEPTMRRRHRRRAVSDGHSDEWTQQETEVEERAATSTGTGTGTTDVNAHASSELVDDTDTGTMQAIFKGAQLFDQFLPASIDKSDSLRRKMDTIGSDAKSYGRYQGSLSLDGTGGDGNSDKTGGVA